MRSARRSARWTSRSPAVGVLPAVEADDTNDLVDVVDDALDDDRRLGVLHRLEQLGQRGLAAVDLLLGHDLALGLDDVLRELEQVFRNSMLVQLPLQVALAQLLEPLAELDEARIAGVLAQPVEDLDLDLLRLLRVGIEEQVLEHVGVEHDRVEVVADRVHVDMLVDELDVFAPSACQISLPVARSAAGPTRRRL